jgi:hypothetical protein
MATGKSVNLRVRPIVSVDLSYPLDGVISWQLDTPVGGTVVTPLGKKVKGLNVGGLYLMLSQTVTGDDSRLLWNSERIYKHLSNVGGQAAGPGVTLLSHLRNASESAALDRAILMRQNAYLTSYSPEVLCEVRRVYYDNPPDQSAVRHRLLKAVEDDAGRIHQGLTNSYTKNAKAGWQGVVEFTTNDNKASQFTGSGIDPVHFEGLSTQYGYEFRYPSAENDLRYHQARAGVRQDFLNAWRMSEMCRHGATTFTNEVGAIDLSILRLQSAYIDTFLFTPTGGIVTNVFHGPGDFVRAGEPVMRVETDDPIYLVGTVKYRGMLRIGSKLNITTTLFEAAAAGAAPTTVPGEVVAVRGHDAVSEQWDVLIMCSNRTGAGDPILPLNYNFDFESTTIDLVAF